MKFFERCIKKDLLHICEKFLDPRQHGFMDSKLCTTQMVLLSVVRRCLTNVFSTELARVGGASFHKEVIHILRNHQGRGGFGMITIMQVLLYPITNLITKGGRGLPKPA